QHDRLRTLQRLPGPGPLRGPRADARDPRRPIRGARYLQPQIPDRTRRPPSLDAAPRRRRRMTSKPQDVAGPAAPGVPETLPEEERKVLEALRAMQFGTLEITVHQ